MSEPSRIGWKIGPLTLETRVPLPSILLWIVILVIVGWRTSSWVGGIENHLASIDTALRSQVEATSALEIDVKGLSQRAAMDERHQGEQDQALRDHGIEVNKEN